MTRNTFYNNEVMIEDYYDGKKNVKLFTQFFHFFDCSNQTMIVSGGETRYFDPLKIF